VFDAEIALSDQQTQSMQILGYFQGQQLDNEVNAWQRYANAAICVVPSNFLQKNSYSNKKKCRVVQD
jgi:hypothetical protein